jgi:hypothetical protein
MASPRKKSNPRKGGPAQKRPVVRQPAAQQPAGDPGERRGTLRPDEMPAEVLEFIQAIDEYKRVQRRPFPTWSEVLEILKMLGYERAR